jgi:hypothetical protein
MVWRLRPWVRRKKEGRRERSRCEGELELEREN